MSELSRSLVDAAAEQVATRLRDETGGCVCDRSYTERGRQDPACAFCSAGGEGFGAVAGRGAVAAVLETLAEYANRPGGWSLSEPFMRRLAAEVKELDR